MKKSSFLVLALAAAGFVLLNLNTSAQAQVVYEGFDYTADAGIGGLSGGVGWDSAWTTFDSNGNPHTVGPGLTLGTLAQTGGSGARLNRLGTSSIDRTITAASTTALTADNSTVWFSVLMSPLGHPLSEGGPFGFELNTYGALIIGDTALGQQPGAAAAPNAGNAVGVGFAGRDNAADPPLVVDNDTYTNMRIQGVTYSAGTLTQDVDNRITVGGVTSLIVGKIDWAANGSDDTLTLYNVLDPTAALPAPFSTMLVDLDQSTFNVVSISAGQCSMFDEIRFGTTQADVLPTGTTAVLLGDVNLDGTVDFLDISPFIAVLSGGTFQAEADCDESGEVDFLDISPFIAILSGS